ncbi:hypothetical protein PIB30_054941, partial [Stylosanthes scabra]|nr:hypothetical protein [Stylosanthes scabra]
MELGSIIQFLEGKTIFVTGATGFLAKIFVEKILRVQPNVRKLYLLVRDKDTQSATERLHNEIAEGKSRIEVQFLCLGKIGFGTGDISQENLNLKNFILEEEIYKHTDVKMNVAGATKFDE